MNNLADFLTTELEKRAWSKRELARRSGISHAQVNDVMNQRSNPGADFCVSVARALGEPPERIMRLAGILPLLPPSVAEEREAIKLLRSFSQQVRDTAMTILRALSHPGRGAQTTSEGVADYDVPRTVSERLAYQLARELEQMPPEDQQWVLDFMKRLQERRRGDGAATRVPVDADP